MNTTFIALSFRRLPLCRVRKRVADWAILSSIDSSKQCAYYSTTIIQEETTGADRRKITIEPLNENPIRSNDGTSSGAIAADRLRSARGYAVENMIETFPKQKQPRRRGSRVVAVVGSHPPPQSLVLTNEKCDTLNKNNDKMTLSSMLDEDLIAKLARRRRVVASSPVAVDSSTVAETKVREHGLVHIMGVHTIENPIRSNDGTSSGALVADRLRMARRKAIENLTTCTEYNNDSNKHPKE